MLHHLISESHKEPWASDIYRRFEVCCKCLKEGWSYSPAPEAYVGWFLLLFCTVQTLSHFSSVPPWALKVVIFQLSLMQNAANTVHCCITYSCSSNSSSHIVHLQVWWANFDQSLETSSWKKSPTSMNSFALLHQYKLSVAPQGSVTSSDFHMWICRHNTSSSAELWRKTRQILLYHLEILNSCYTVNHCMQFGVSKYDIFQRSNASF